MAAYIARRIGATLVVMTIVGCFVFLLLHLAPGDPAAIIAGDTATPANIAAIRSQLGLDAPLLVQFGRWVGNLCHGDLGVSVFSEMPVMQLVQQRLQPTISLTIITLVISITISVSSGVIAAWRARGIWDRAVMAFAVLGYSVPVFVVGYLLVYFFSIRFRWLPVQGYTSIDQGLWPWLSHLILPGIALGFSYQALIARITRTTMLEVLDEDYIRTAVAKGASTVSVLLNHALKNAAVPIVTTIGIGVAGLISGVVITETVFNIPGIGRLTVDAVANRDYPIIQGVMILVSAAYVLINLAIDLIYTVIDPRIRY